MSLAVQTTTTYSTAVYSGTAEVGCIVENFSRSIGTTSEDRGISPATGKTALYGNQSNEEIAGSLSGITYGTTDLMAATVGSVVVLLTSLAIAGHAATGRTTVITGIDFAKANGSSNQFQRGTWTFISLPFTAV